jgi:hypothetical protein
VLPKNLIASLPYRIARDGVPKAYCLGSRCTPQDGMRKTVRQSKALEAVVAVCYVFAERSDLSFIGTEGGEQAAREAKQTIRRRTERSRIHFGKSFQLPRDRSVL